jgi:hypothetical protein
MKSPLLLEPEKPLLTDATIWSLKSALVRICSSHSDRHFLMKMNLLMDAQFNLAGSSSGMHCRPYGSTCRLAKRRSGQLCLVPG